MNTNQQAYYEEIRSSCPSMTEDEVIEAGDSLLQIFKLLHEAVQDNPELQDFINAQLGKDNIDEQI